MKVEVGYGFAGTRANDFSGSYVELAYRSQRDNRSFYWEVNAGFLVNLFTKWNTVFGLPYGGVSVGVYF
ncbi:MAG: hypothetical protein HC803_09230 [Saprospiraceae bacterium]|nr:hypothetical protein [Saprospiraceae bacterium]